MLSFFRKNLIIIAMLIFTFSFAQSDDFSDESSSLINVSGVVTNTDGKPLAGANIVIVDSDLGVASDEEGSFAIEDVPLGSEITASVIGYETSSIYADTSVVNFVLTPSAVMLGALDVVAKKATFRETPVAFSEITKEDISLRVASQDLSMVLNSTPGVHSSVDEGGAGDSKVVVRGFDQLNTAVLINGVPVNDMENGRLFWSNWDGIADVTSSIQIQRGLGASNLAVASAGGTIDIKTSAASMEKGYGFKQELGSENFYKTTFSYNTGVMDNGYSISTLLQAKSGLGYVDGTWTNGYSYFLAVNKAFGDHIIDFTLLGAPQQHGQRDGDNSHENFNQFSDYNTEYGSDDFRQINTGNSGSGWGYISDEDYDKLTIGTDESLDGLSDMLFGGIQHTKKIDGKWMINNRTNYYHKPVYSLNHHWKIADNMSLSSVVYGSNGRGGGTGPLNSRGNFYGNGTYDTDYYKYVNPKKDDQGRYDWGTLINWNDSDWDSENYGDPDYIVDERRSKAIIRASVNHHDWYGALSTFKYKDLVPDVTFSGGFDIRSYKGIHYREVVNLLGGDYYVDTYAYGRDYSDINDTDVTAIKRVGDKVAYHNIGYNSWAGGFVQAEYAKNDITAFFSAAGSNTTYQREDFFNYTDESGDQKSEKASYPGSAIKVGANYNVNENLNVFFNTGALSIAPKFDFVYLNYNNTVNPEAKNEGIVSAELGLGYQNSNLALFGLDMDVKTAVNYYNTNWTDKTIVEVDDNLIYNIEGVDAKHSGIEFETSLGLMNNSLTLYSVLSLGSWEWANNVVGNVTSDYAPSDTSAQYQVSIYADGLPVGDAPQTQVVAGAVYKSSFGLTLNPVLKFMDRHYENYSPEEIDYDWKAAGFSPEGIIYQIENYMTIDLHAQYSLGEMLPVPTTLGFHLLNLTDAEYFTTRSQGDGGFYGPGTTFNISLSVSL